MKSHVLLTPSDTTQHRTENFQRKKKSRKKKNKLESENTKKNKKLALTQKMFTTPNNNTAWNGAKMALSKPISRPQCKKCSLSMAPHYDHNNSNKNCFNCDVHDPNATNIMNDVRWRCESCDYDQCVSSNTTFH